MPHITPRPDAALLLVLPLLLALAACGTGGSSAPAGSSPPADGGDAPDGSLRGESLDDQIAGDVRRAEGRGCDWLAPSYCHFPWPNDHFTAADPDQATGKRLDLQLAGMPLNLVGIPVRPEEWNFNDGFSPGQMMLTHVEGLDLEATGAAPVTDIEASLAPDAPILVIDAATGERHPVWAEMDTSGTAQTPLCGGVGSLSEAVDLIAGEVDIDALDPEALSALLGSLGEGCAQALAPLFAVLGETLQENGPLPGSIFRDDPPALILRPGINFANGRRYIVALRRLRNAEGEIIEAPPHFRVFRDRHASDLEAVNTRREHFEDLFARLEQAGVARDELYMAWDFTVASTRNLAGRVLHMRDEALQALGDAAPNFEIVSVEDFDDGASIRRIEGRMRVPNYLNLPDGLCDNTPLLSELADYCAAVEAVTQQLAATEAPVISDVAGGIADGLQLLLRELGQIPLSTLNYDNPRGEFPAVNPVQPQQDFRFQCEIPRTAIGAFDDPDTWVRPAAPTLYGHGLLGSKGEVGGSSTARLRELNFLHCAIDWIGMATRDVPSALLILLDAGNFRSLSDRLQQGLVNWAFLARLLAHPEGLSAHPAFQSADGRPVFDRSEVYYDGNSQGGIKGGSLMATAVDVIRGSLGVPGMNYSTLLRRSVDFDGFGVFLYTSYPNSFDQSFLLSLIENLWERGEANGYAEHLLRPDAFNALGNPTPDKKVLMHTALGDHQVANLSAEVMARTMGAAVHQPATMPGRHSNVRPFWGIADAVEGNAASTMVVWDIGPLDNPFNPGVAVAPDGNIPPREGVDPHSDPRKEVASGIQRYDFLVRDRYTNICGPRPCFAREYLSPEVASGAAGNQPPLVRAPGPALARDGGEVELFAIGADPDRDELALQWQVTEGADCVAGLQDADSTRARLQLNPGCAGRTLRVTVSASDGRGGESSEDSRIEVLP